MHLGNELTVALFWDWKWALWSRHLEKPRLKKMKLAVVYTWVPD